MSKRMSDHYFFYVNRFFYMISRCYNPKMYSHQRFTLGQHQGASSSPSES